MKEQIGLGAFGTFGEPYGYQQVFFLNAVFNSSLDLNANAIEVCPGAELYAVKREVVNGASTICCCLYTYAKEAASNRGGTFIGSCVVLSNSYLKGESICNLLRELHTDLTGNPKNIIDNTLQVPKAEQLEVTEPAGFAAVQAKAVPVTSASTPVDAQRKFLIQPPGAPQPVEKCIAAFFEEAITYFTDTDTLYFTTDRRIMAYVAEKGLLPIANWAAFQQYKTQRQQQEREARQKAAAQPQAAAKPPAAPAKVPDVYEPWMESKPDKEVLRKMITNHNLLLQELLQLKEVQHTAPASNGTTAYAATSSRSAFRIRKKHLLYTNIVLLALLITTSCMLLFRSRNAVEQATAVPTAVPAVDSVVPVQSMRNRDTLSPVPNTALTKGEAAKLVTRKIKGKGLRQIVDAVFLQNPTTVAAPYSWQKQAYADLLLQKNKSCFKEDSATYTCTCDTLSYIPAFSKRR